MYSLVYLINYLILMIMVLVGVAFFTLLERKMLGYIHIWSGPNKVSYVGMLQPFFDALKLLSKEVNFPTMINLVPFFFGPGLGLILSLMVWVMFPVQWGLMDFELGFLFFMCCTSLSVYFLLMAGWGSNSKYSLLGSLRAVAQIISYEVSLALLLIGFVTMVGGYDFEGFYSYQEYLWFVVYMLPLFLMWFCSSLAELNRTPFDFVEGESELVSGFNIEYGGMNFALIFISEYAWILFSSMVVVVVFMGGYSYLMFIKVVIIGGIVVWVRGTLPRFRYDKLMDLAWKSFLPVILIYLVFIFNVKLLI
uniref:NADH-ubiquinone oxidoreductase chain 1 n=1 Tax=Sphaerotheriidae sp. HYS-2012 TaxID=1170231 RepID=I6PDS4_9MYRI|nr:NADH dehydrogenase subunit 1 [Sphaerotheriidae sp. HYS-2012]AFH54823.1 NADH dehydrogenase subunit 1 [Sphaerotheriidae sp. HYS-2012]